MRRSPRLNSGGLPTAQGDRKFIPVDGSPAIHKHAAGPTVRNGCRAMSGDFSAEVDHKAGATRD